MLIIPYDHSLSRMTSTGTRRSRPHCAVMNVYCPLACWHWTLHCTCGHYDARVYGMCASDSLTQASLALDSGHSLCQQLESLGTVTSRKAKKQNELSASEKGPCRHTHPTSNSSSKTRIWAHFACCEIMLVSMFNYYVLRHVIYSLLMQTCVLSTAVTFGWLGGKTEGSGWEWTHNSVVYWSGHQEIPCESVCPSVYQGFANNTLATT